MFLAPQQDLTGLDDRELAAYLGQLAAEDQALEARLAQPDALAQAAAWYVTNGYPVFPIQPRGKMPALPAAHRTGDAARGVCKGECGRTGHGLHDATTDPAVVAAWWQQMPDANIGIPTGVHFDVIDVDTKDRNPAGAAAGFQSLATLRENDDLPPAIAKAWTPSGGRHWCIPPTGDGNTARFMPGLDYRGAGGYIVVPPSIGANGRRYAWIQPLQPAARSLGGAA